MCLTREHGYFFVTVLWNMLSVPGILLLCFPAPGLLASPFLTELQ
jgi:hypothetical protein